MKKCAVLIVEDDESVQQLLRAVLRKHCSSVAEASDGEEAIALLQRERFDVVVLDIMLPKVNGLTVADTIRALPSPPKVIVLSAISRYFADRFPEGTVVLQKPFGINRVVEALHRIGAV